MQHLNRTVHAKQISGDEEKGRYRDNVKNVAFLKMKRKTFYAEVSIVFRQETVLQLLLRLM